MQTKRQFDLRSVVTFISGIPLCRPNRMGGVDAILEFMANGKTVTTPAQVKQVVIEQCSDLWDQCANPPERGQIKGWYNKLEGRFGPHITLTGPWG